MALERFRRHRQAPTGPLTGLSATCLCLSLSLLAGPGPVVGHTAHLRLGPADAGPGAGPRRPTGSLPHRAGLRPGRTPRLRAVRLRRSRVGRPASVRLALPGPRRCRRTHGRGDLARPAPRRPARLPRVRRGAVDPGRATLPLKVAPTRALSRPSLPVATPPTC